jgi:hypothetical protein
MPLSKGSTKHLPRVPNPTGKGGIVKDDPRFKPGVSGHTFGQKIAAGHKLTHLISQILLEDSENGVMRAENMIRKQAQLAEEGSLDALKFFTDRILGAQGLTVALNGEERVVSRIEFVVVDPINEPVLIEGHVANSSNGHHSN